MFGERYTEPVGHKKFRNQTTGETCEMEYKARGAWITKEEDK